MPYWLGGYYYLRYFVKKNRDSSVVNYLPRAHLLNIISILLQTIWGIVGGYIFWKGPLYYQSFMFGNALAYGYKESMIIVANVVSLICWITLNWYWLVVTKRFATGNNQDFAQVVQEAAD